MYRVVGKRQLSSAIALLEVEAPAIAAKVEPGQFIILRIDEIGERIPLTVSDFDRGKGTLTIVVQDVGYSSARIIGMNIGDEFLDFVGPLGIPSEIENYGTVVCIGAGLGVAPIYPIARALKAAGNRVISIVGSRSADLLILEEEMRTVSDEVVITTNDGSRGVKGFLTHGLIHVLKQGHQVDRIWAIGPVPCMKAIVDYTRPREIKTIVSLNPIMVDGTGMCGACRVSVGNETKFACVDGPEFDGHLVDFDLALQRLTFYRDEENRARARLECNHEGGRH
ncbi:MAG: sulfide/dihydroorotate dehydrogenase-like FAD/NAD-binding protein [Desulfosporosinus sp.]